MSSGSVFVDGRVLTPLTGCSPQPIGTYYSKTWSGGDGPHSENDYSMSLRVHTGTVLWLRNLAWNKPWKTYGVTCGFQPVAYKPALSPNHMAILVNRLDGMVKMHDFNAAVNIGEARESVRMIRDTARTLARTMIYLKQGKVTRALDTLGVSTHKTRVREVQQNLRDSVANAWLGLTYGWAPLLGAAEDGAHAFASLTSNRKARFSTRMKVDGPIGNYGSGTNRHTVQLIWKVEQGSGRLSEFGFTSPSLIAWELMPYSFVVDWFVPIGNFLQARAAVRDITGKYILTYTHKVRASAGFSPAWAHRSGHYTEIRVDVSRKTGPISKLPLPGPAVKDPFSIGHTLSALALLQRAFGR